MKRSVKIIVTVVILVVIAIGAVSWHRAQAAKNFVHEDTPTIFVHGWGSSYHAETKMVNAARLAGVTNTVVRANVSRSGYVTFNKQVPAKAVNPIVEVNLADNKLTKYGKTNDYVAGYHHGATYVKNVVTGLEKQHHYRAINLVGHSMGNLEIINYINDNTGAIKSGQLPRINHLVAIAGHYNGLMGQKQAENATLNHAGKPSWEDPTYKALLSLRTTFPRNTRVLDIYGDLGDGSHSDKDVPVNSAKSLKYLVANRAKSFHELEIHGPRAEHSRLHNNRQVNRALINFLWAK